MRALTHGVATPALLLATATLAGVSGLACGRVPGQFEIVNDQVPQAGSCAIPTDETVYSGQGRLDLSLVQAGAESAYFFFPLIKNNLPPSSSGPDVNQIFLSSFAVDIKPLGPAPAQTQVLFDKLNSDPSSADYALLHYQTPWSGSVGSGGSKISAFVAAFPTELAHRIGATGEVGLAPSLWVNLRVRAFGSTTTQTLESDPFDYPVSVCSGCLVANLSPCPYSSAPANPGNPCNVAQDYPVDCCLSGSNLICPAVVAQ